MPTHTTPRSEQGALLTPVPPQREIHSHRFPPPAVPLTPHPGDRSHARNTQPATPVPPTHRKSPHATPTPPKDAGPPLPSTEGPGGGAQPQRTPGPAPCSATNPRYRGSRSHRLSGPSGAGSSRGPGAAGTYSGPHHPGTRAGEHAPPPPPNNSRRARPLVEITPLRRRMVQPQDGGLKETGAAIGAG